jgi:hypothetical protein
MVRSNFLWHDFAAFQLMMVSSRSSPRCWVSPVNTELLEAKAKRFAGEQREATSGVRKPYPAWIDELRDRSEQTIAVDEGRHKRAAPGIGFTYYLTFLGASNCQ